MKKQRKILAIILIIIALVIIRNQKVYAASASITASNTKVTTGTSVNINASIVNAASWTLSASSSGGTLTLDEDRVGSTKSGNNENVTVKVGTFSANSPGTYTITLDGNVVDGTSLTKNKASGSVIITVSNPSSSNSGTSSSGGTTTTTTKSSEARLKTLGITPNDFSGFKADKYEYSVEVPNSVTSVKIYGTAKDSKATVSGTGTKKLDVGKNTAKVTVKAEDGTTKTYTVTITRKDGNDETNTTTNTTTNEVVEETTEESEETDGIVLGLEKLEIKDYTLNPEFSTSIYEYTIDVGTDVNSLDINAIANIEGATVEIAGNENFVDGENIVTILVTNDETEETATYQITVNKGAVLPEDLLSNDNNQIIKMWAIRVAIVLAAGIIIAVLVVTYKKQDGSSKSTAIPYSGIGYKTEWEDEKEPEVRVSKKENIENENPVVDLSENENEDEDDKKGTRNRTEEEFDEALKKYGKHKGKHF